MSDQVIHAFTESWGDIVDRSEPYFDDITSSYQRAQYCTMRRDRLDGRFLPVYDNEVDLSVIRAMSRLMHERVPMAKARTRRLIDYTVSRGFDWDITHEDKELGKLLSGIVKRFMTDNKFAIEGERESFEAECVDGEWLAELSVDAGEICLNVLTSDNLVEPASPRELEEYYGVDFDASWSFGVLSPRLSPNRPKMYHIVRDDGGVDWDCVPESRFLHWKRNTPSMAKRGFGDSYTTHVYLGRADKVLANTAEGAAVQAAIAYIVEHVPGTSSTQAANVVSNLLNVTRPDGVTGVPRRAKKIVPGQRLDIPSGMKYHAGLFGSNNSQVYIQVMESLIRLSGTVDAMPEHMLTGSAENNNMASSLVAESPFVQGRLADQEVRKMRFVSLIEKVCRLAVKMGRIRGYSWQEVEAGLTITVQEPSIVSRDPVALAQSLAILKENGWVSDRTASQQLGLDYEEERVNKAKEAPPTPPPGMPGLPGQPPAPGLPGMPAVPPPGQTGGPPAAGKPPVAPVAPAPQAPKAAGVQESLGEFGRAGGRSLSASDVSSVAELLRYAESAPAVLTTEDGLRIQERDLALWAADNQGAHDFTGLPVVYQAWFDLETVSEEVKDGDGDGLIYDGKPNEQPVPMKTPKVKVKKSAPGTHAGAGSSDVDTTGWSMDSKSGKWAIEKVHAMEAAAAKGDITAVQQAFAKSDKSKAPNSYQKGVLKAQANLLAKHAAKATAPAPKGTWTKVGGQLGSQEGGTYTGPDGGKYYVKTSNDIERPKNEALAFRLYQAAGAGTVDSTLAVVDGKMGVATKWMESTKVTWDAASKAEAAEDFAVHAWLANWDAVGHVSEMDNIRRDATGKLRLVDAGGSLTQKAMGGEKPFGSKVLEWDTLRDPALNPSGHIVFGGMTPQQLIASTKKLHAVKDEHIEQLVSMMGPMDAAKNTKLKDVLIARRDDLIIRGEELEALEGMPAVGASADPAGPKAAPMAVPAPYQMKSAKNMGYQKHFDAIHAAALDGNLDAVKAYPTNATSKQTYAAKLHKYKQDVLAAMGSGGVATAAKPAQASKPVPEPPQTVVIAFNNTMAQMKAHALAGDVAALKDMGENNHFMYSGKVKAYHQQLTDHLAGKSVAAIPGSPLDAPAAPAAPAKKKSYAGMPSHEALASKVADLAKDIPNKPSANSQKVGYWSVVGSVPLAEKHELGSWTASGTPELWSGGEKAWNGLSVELKDNVQMYTGGSYSPFNKSLRGTLTPETSKFTPEQIEKIKRNAEYAAKGVAKAAKPLQLGMTLSRKHDGDMTKLKPGDVVSDAAILSTSTDPYAWHGSNTWKMTVGPGVKGLPVNNFSKNKGEYEIVLPPNTRLAVTQVIGDKYGAEIHAIILPNEHHL